MQLVRLLLGPQHSSSVLPPPWESLPGTEGSLASGQWLPPPHPQTLPGPPGAGLDTPLLHARGGPRGVCDGPFPPPSSTRSHGR